MEWRRCGARQGFPEQLIIMMIMMRIKIMIITLRLFVKIMIQGPFNFLDLSEKDDGLDYEMRMVVILLFLMIVMKIYQQKWNTF